MQNTERTFADLLTAVDWSLDRLAFRVRDTFRDTSWVGKDVLEIGCGRGDVSIFMALNGARSVMAIEPTSTGGSRAAAELLRRRLDLLKLRNLTFAPVTVEELDYPERSFDLVFGIQVVEHLYETRELVVKGSPAYVNYVKAFRHVHRLLRPGGSFVLTDVSRSSLWTLVRRIWGRRFVSPLAPTVYWEIHQYPRTWRRVAEDAGFGAVAVHWRVPYQLRSLPWVADNRVFQYFTFASYILRARRQ